MFNLRTVLPNFIYAALVATAAISFSAFAQYQDQEEATETAVESAAEITDAAEGTMIEAKEYSAEAIDGYQEVTETGEELEQETDVIESE